MKTAIIQCADTGPLESIVVMLRSAGYECYTPSTALKEELRSIGCSLVLDIDGLVNRWGYDRPFKMPEAAPEMMDKTDIYVDIKAHRDYSKLVGRWPNLKGRILWYRINGGQPEHVVNSQGDFGDEANPPCPVLTPNQWYAQECEECCRCYGTGESPPGEMCWECDGAGECKTPWHDTPRYVSWPPFHRFSDYSERKWSTENERLYGLNPGAPVCLIHNVAGWGYGPLIEPLRGLGMKAFGVGSPDGLIRHAAVKDVLSYARCMLHLKSSDAPGYALYEALASGCPVVCTRRLIWRCRMQELLIENETCLCFDRETHDPLSAKDVEACAAEVAAHLERLRDSVDNRRIGEAGRQRLKQIMWSPDRPADVSSLQVFMEHNFG